MRPRLSGYVTRLGVAVSVAFAIGLTPDCPLAATRIAGNVWQIEPESGLVTIIDAGQRHTFSYGEGTIIRKGNADRTIKDLRRGDRIVVSLDAEGGYARLIAIAGPPVPGHGLSIFP